MATEFEKIKNAVAEERRKKMQGEARIESLDAEKERLIKEANELTNQNFTTVEEIQAYADQKGEEIADHIKEMSSILREEGVLY